MTPPEPPRAGEPETTRHGKSAAAFRTTSEVAEELDLPTHVLRFWESKFAQVKPLKRGGGRRYYRPEDVDLLRRIRQCLYQHGYTIRGVQQLLRDGVLPSGAAASPPPVGTTHALFFLEPPGEPRSTGSAPAPAQRALREALEETRRELQEIRGLLDKLIGHK
ncbi:MAG: MerR family transcriptional regulator [Stellaceae bacterium]